MRRAWLPLLAVPFAWLTPATRVSVLALLPEARPTATQREIPRCALRTPGGYCLPLPRCGQDELDLDGLCIPVANAADEGGGGLVEVNAHVDRTGRRVVYEHLPRRRDLPADYARYVYPVPPDHHVVSGYDLDRPDALQRRGAHLSAVGHGAVDLDGARGTPIRAVSLRGESSEPEVVFIGQLFGNTVVLRHVVREGSSLRTYLAFHGHLDAPAPNLHRGMSVPQGTVIGFMGDSGAIGLVHLHYEVRLLRTGLDPTRLDPWRLADQEYTVPCDPRNVLPLR